jgi:hypothetical protein
MKTERHRGGDTGFVVAVTRGAEWVPAQRSAAVTTGAIGGSARSREKFQQDVWQCARGGFVLRQRHEGVAYVFFWLHL